MTRKQFLKWWETYHAPEIKKMYEGDPHGVACSIFTTMDSNDDGARFWRRHRAVLSQTTVEDWTAIMAQKKGASNEVGN